MYSTYRYDTVRLSDDCERQMWGYFTLYFLDL